MSENGQRDDDDAHGTGGSIAVIVIVAIVALIAGGAGGFFYAKNKYANQPAPRVARQAARTAAAPAKPALPPGVKRLPSRAFGHWALNCVQNAKNVKSCEISLRVVDRKTHGVLLDLLVGRNGKGKPVYVVVTPPNVTLPAGLRLGFGKQPEVKANFVNCSSQACRVVLLVDKKLQDQLSKADTTKVSYVAGNGRTIAFNLPTAKFSEAFAAWQKE